MANIDTNNYITQDDLKNIGLPTSDDQTTDLYQWNIRAIWLVSQQFNGLSHYATLESGWNPTPEVLNLIKLGCVNQVNHWKSQGLELSRLSASFSSGGYSGSQSNPREPNYISRESLIAWEKTGLFTKEDSYNASDIKKYNKEPNWNEKPVENTGAFLQPKNIIDGDVYKVSYNTNPAAVVLGFKAESVFKYTDLPNAAQYPDGTLKLVTADPDTSKNGLYTNLIVNGAKIWVLTSEGSNSAWTSPDASIRVDNNAKTLMVATDIEQQLETIGTVSNLTTQNKRDLVSAVNEVNAKTGKTYTGGTGIVVDNTANTVSLDSGTQITLAQVGTNTNAIATNTGDITALKTKVGTATLNTTAKDLSGAVNELNTKPSGKTYTPGDTSISIDNTANTIKVSDTFQQKVTDIETAVSTLQDNQGSLSNLVTPDKTTLVNAINDSFGVGTKARQEIGTLASLTTQAKDNLVDAVNEVNNKPAGNIYPQLKTDLVAGSNITIQANDTNSTLTISSVGGVAPDIYPQLKTDILGGTNVTIVPDDTNKTLTINAPQRTYTAGDSSLVFNQVASSVTVSSDIQTKVGTIGAVNTLKTSFKTNTVGAINETYDAVELAITNIGQLSALNTQAKTSTVAAINEVNTKAIANAVAISTNAGNIQTNTTNITALGNKVGDITALTTTNKTSTVAAINEVNAKPSGKVYTAGTGIDVDNSANTIALNQDTTDALAQIGTDKGRIDTLITNVGDVSLLNTPTKEVVTGINEVLTNQGALTSLTTSDKTNLVDAINEVNAKTPGGSNIGDALFTNITGQPNAVRISHKDDDQTTGFSLFADGGKVLSVPSGKSLFVSANGDVGKGVNGQALTKGFSISEAGGMVLTGINLTGLTTPTVGNQAATKDYVDGKVSPVDVYTQTKAIVQGNPTIVVTPDDTAKTLTLSAPQVTTNAFNIGTLSTLTTTNKTTLVGAINEVNAKPSGGGKDWIQFQDQTAWTYDSGNKVWNANTPLTDGSYKVVIYSRSSYYTILLDNTNNNGFGVILANITTAGIDFIKFLPNQLALLTKIIDETTPPNLTANGNETFIIYRWQFPI